MGDLHLPNRLVMSPMTRSRALTGALPGPLMVEYYRQRAGAGLIITEGAHISPQGRGAPSSPGIYNTAQTEAWSRVTEAVHAAGGRVFLQLWHAGRLSHPSLQPDGSAPVAPSAVMPEGSARAEQGDQPPVLPRPLDVREIPAIVDDYRRAAEAAKAAGFDGVDIDGAGGYLIDQFIREHTNRRTDRYGGSAANRARLLLEVVEAVTPVFGPGRTGVRLSPVVRLKGGGFTLEGGDYAYAIEALDRFGLAYLTLVEAPGLDYRPLRNLWTGPYLANGGYDLDQADIAVASGAADFVAFGPLFISNPDLAVRIDLGAPLTPADPATFYGGGARGYIDYPRFSGRADPSPTIRRLSSRPG